MEEKKDFEIGFTDSSQGMLVFFIPLKTLVDDKENGTALLRGKIDELRGIVLMKIQELRNRKAQAGIIQGNGKPLHIA